MLRFSYQAKKGPKEIVKGVIEAENQGIAVDKLVRMGYVPISIIQADVKVFKDKSSSVSSIQQSVFSKFSRRVRSKSLTMFTEQLASLVKAKVPLLEAMGVLVDQTEDIRLKEIILHIGQEIKNGRTLSQSFRDYHEVFSPLYINMTESGEAGGVLEKILIRLADFRNREEELKSKVSSALVYPIFIIIVGIVTIFILFTFIIPRMSSLFADFGQNLPLATKLLLSLSGWSKKYWPAVMVIAGLAVFIFKKLSLGNNGSKVIARFKLKLPLLGNIIKRSEMAKFCRTFSLLLNSGIPVFQAIKITIPTLDNEIFKAELELVRSNIITGMSLEQSIKKSPWFPRFMTNMLAVGERGGNLKDALLEIASFYEREVDRATKAMTSLIEPVIILVMGLGVGFIVFAMLLPIFQINMGM